MALIYCSLALLFHNVHKSDYVRARVLGEPFKVITKDKSTENSLKIVILYFTNNETLTFFI